MHLTHDIQVMFSYQLTLFNIYKKKRYFTVIIINAYKCNFTKQYFFPFLGHRVGEVAHDYVPALKTWLNGKGIKNSYDSWHGMATMKHRKL